MWNSTIVSTPLLFFSIFLSTSVSAEDATNERIQSPVVGEQATVIGVRFAIGLWAAEHQMTCPSARYGNEPKIAIYTTTLNDNVLNLSLAVDRLIAEDASLKWSFVALSDEKGAYSGVVSKHYSKDEQAERLSEIKKLATRKGITQLTIGNTSWPASRTRHTFDMSEDSDVLVLFLDGDSQMLRVVKFVRLVDSAKLNSKMIDSMLAEIKTIRDH